MLIIDKVLINIVLLNTEPININITKNNIKKWWNIRYFIDGAIADGGHVHPIRLEHDVIKRTILQAVEIAEKE